MKKVIKMYLHSSKEDNTDIFIDKFLEGDYNRIDDVPNAFRYALYEVELDVEVDSETGETKILKVNGQKLYKPE